MGAILSERPAEHSELGVGEAPMLADGEGAEAQRTEGDAPQGEHGMPDGLAHPSYLAVAAFADRQLELVAAAQAARTGGSGRTVIELHAGAQRAQSALGDR